MSELLTKKSWFAIYCLLSFLLVIEATYHKVGFRPQGILFLLSFILLIYVSWVDLRDQAIEWKILALGVASGIIASISVDGFTLQILLSLVTAAIVPIILVAVSRETWMGWGDVVIALWIGALAGFPYSAFAILFAFLAGALSGILVLSAKHGHSPTFAFAPYLLIGCLYSVLFADRIISWYLKTM